MRTALRNVAGVAGGVVVLGLIGPATATAAGAAGAGIMATGIVHVVHGIGGNVNTNQSSNWSGYNIGADYPQVSTGTTFTSVSGQWTVPTATQRTAGQAEDSASWVGIGGGCVNDGCTVTDNTLIQAGTEQDVSATGQTSYDAWWEIIPETETLTTLKVSPGNKIAVSIAESSSTPGQWSIVIKNLTTHKSFSTTTPYTSSMDTVEWIEETPLEIGTTGSGIAAMPNLSTVHFIDAKYNGANAGFRTVDEMQLDNNNMIEATPSGPGAKMVAFNDCTWKTTCPAP
jgi:hypothetical protein